MTTTAIISAVSCGTGANTGPLFNPVKTTLQVTTTTVKIAAKIVFVAGTTFRPNVMIRILHAVSPTSYGDATLGLLALRVGAAAIEIPVNPTQSLTHEVSSEVLITAAGYHYCWLDMPNLEVAGAITVNLLELP